MGSRTFMAPPIPLGNLLTDNQASLETNLTGWATGSGQASRSTTMAYVGAASLLSTSPTGTGARTVQTPTALGSVLAVTAATAYAFAFWARTAAGTGTRNVNILVSWRNAAGSEITTAQSSSISTGESAWVRHTFTATSPALTVGVSFRPQWTATADGQAVHFDGLGVWLTAIPAYGNLLVGGNARNRSRRI